jgi:hypothetical protein
VGFATCWEILNAGEQYPLQRSGLLEQITSADAKSRLAEFCVSNALKKMENPNPSEVLTIIAIVLNFIALCIVSYQTYLNRRSLNLAKEGIDQERKTRQNMKKALAGCRKFGLWRWHRRFLLKRH